MKIQEIFEELARKNPTLPPEIIARMAAAQLQFEGIHDLQTELDYIRWALKEVAENVERRVLPSVTN